MTELEKKALQATLENLIKSVTLQSESIDSLAGMMGHLTTRIMKLEEPPKIGRTKLILVKDK